MARRRNVHFHNMHQDLESFFLLAGFGGKNVPCVYEEECGGKVSLWFRVRTKSIFVPVVMKDVET